MIELTRTAARLAPSAVHVASAEALVSVAAGAKIAGRDHVRAPKCLPYSHAQTVTSVYGLAGEREPRPRALLDQLPIQWLFGSRGQ